MSADLFLAAAPPEVAALGPPERVFVSRPKWQRAMLGPLSGPGDEFLMLGWVFMGGAIVCAMLWPVLLINRATAAPVVCLLAVVGAVTGHVSFLVPEGVQAVVREEVDNRIWIIARGSITWCAEKWEEIPTRVVLPRLILDLCPNVKVSFTLDEESFR